MKRITFLTFFPAILAISAGAASANQFSDDVVSQLTRQGFSSITQQSTWLGRVQIEAQRKDGRREIVLNPRTGEILRDEWTATTGAVATRPILDDVGGASSNSSSGTSGSDSGSSDGSSGSGSSSGSDDSKSDSGSGSGESSGSNSGSNGDHESSGGEGTDN